MVPIFSKRLPAIFYDFFTLFTPAISSRKIPISRRLFVGYVDIPLRNVILRIVKYPNREFNFLVFSYVKVTLK